MQHIQNRFGTAGLVVAIVALLTAMSGGAYAAAHASKAKPLTQAQIIKLIKKYAGKGPAGTPGANGTAGANGTNGTAGASGAAGADGRAAGYAYLFNTDVANTDPGAGKLKLNNATPGSATTMRISKTDNNAAGISAAIATWDDSTSTVKGFLTIRKVAAPGTFAQYSISALADAGAFDNLTVAFVSGNGSFANNDPVSVEYSRTGDKGSAGAAGSPWVVGKAPTDALLQGTWSVQGYTATAASEKIPVPISYSVPVDSSGVFAADYVPVASQDNSSETFGCIGDANNPTVEAGFNGIVCIYEASGATNLDPPPAGSFGLPTELEINTDGGIVFYAQSHAAGIVKGYGTWAVLAP